MRNRTPWYKDGLSFACTQCGNCCTGPPGFVWFTEAEGRAMAQRLGVDEAEFYRRFAKRVWGKWSLTENVQDNGDHDCVFLRRDAEGRALCSVYDARPTQCRTWPFWPSNLRSQREWDRAAEHCPGMSQGGRFVPADQVRILADKTPGL